MPWETTNLENRMYEALERELTPTRADTLRSLYVRARDKLVGQVLPQINGVNPKLSDHSAAHVQNVLENANKLVGEDAFERADRPPLRASDAYILCLGILFHDTGMVYGRDGHERSLSRVHEWVRNGEQEPLQERWLVYRIAGAHTGVASSGRKDTVGELPETGDLDGERVQVRELAAILRFADELAEGPHRTSYFMTETFGYPEGSEVFHRYAEITNVHIDRGNNRVALNYTIPIGENGSGYAPDSPSLKELLEFTFHRIIKLDKERRYAAFYSRRLAPFRKTEATLNFWSHGVPVLDLGPVELSDKTVLDEVSGKLSDIDDGFQVDDVVSRIKNAVEGAEHDAF